MEQNNTLPEDIRQKIETDGDDYGDKTGDRLTNIREYFTHGDRSAGYTEGATVWATKFQEVVEENARLRKALDEIKRYTFGTNNIFLLDMHELASKALAQKGGDGNG